MPASKLLAALGEVLTEPEGIVRAVGEEAILPGVQDNIRAGGFAPLKEETLREKRGYAPLIESGRLLESLSPGHPDNVADVDGNEGFFGTGVPYGPLVNDGADRMPARPFMVLNDRITSDAADTAMDAILQEI